VKNNSEAHAAKLISVEPSLCFLIKAHSVNVQGSLYLDGDTM